MQLIEQSIDQYLAAMDWAERATREIVDTKPERLKEQIETLKKHMQHIEDHRGLASRQFIPANLPYCSRLTLNGPLCKNFD
jgi:hypothetical protein